MQGTHYPVTHLLEEAVDTVRRMPADAQDDIARAMLALARIGTPATIDPDDLADVLNGLADIANGDIASDSEVEAAFRRFNP